MYYFDLLLGTKLSKSGTVDTEIMDRVHTKLHIKLN